MPDIQLIRYHKPGTACILRPESTERHDTYMVLWGILASKAGVEIEYNGVFEFIHDGLRRAALFTRDRVLFCTPGVKGRVEILDN